MRTRGRRCNFYYAMSSMVDNSIRQTRNLTDIGENVSCKATLHVTVFVLELLGFHNMKSRFSCDFFYHSNKHHINIEALTVGIEVSWALNTHN